MGVCHCELWISISKVVGNQEHGAAAKRVEVPGGQACR